MARGQRQRNPVVTGALPLSNLRAPLANVRYLSRGHVVDGDVVIHTILNLDVNSLAPVPTFHLTDDHTINSIEEGKIPLKPEVMIDIIDLSIQGNRVGMNDGA